MLPASVLYVCCASGCTELTPACDASQAKKEVLRVIHETTPLAVDAHIERVHTLRTNFATGEVLCSAAVVATDANAEKLQLSVGYNVHFDKQRRVSVSVYGAP